MKTETAPIPRGPGLWERLRTSSTRVDFYGRRRRGVAFSVLISVVAVASLMFQGLNLGLDFKGGVAWEVPVGGGDADWEEMIERVFAANGIDAADLRIQTLTSAVGETRVRAEVAEVAPETQALVTAGLAEALGVSVDGVTTESVSSRWGRSVTDKAVRALIVFLAVVTMFILWRFRWKMAVASLVAVVHDVLVAVGLYSVFRFEFTPATVVAMLTILGYSLYDTIVLFQRVAENEEKYPGSKVAYGDIVNISANSVLMRTINTSITSLVPVMSLLVVGSFMMGVTALRDFALALIVGMAVGFYSSLFVALPMLSALKEREPRFAASRGRRSDAVGWAHLAESGSSVVGDSRRARVSGLDRGGEARSRSVSEGASSIPSTSAERALSHPPRPRKRRRR
jgi:preprotein translocase subunit SecF